MKRCAPLWRWRLVDDVLKVVTGATCLCRCCCCWDGSVSRKIIILHINHIENKHSVCVCVHTTHHVMAWVNIISVEGATRQLWLISKSTWNMTHWIIFKHSFKMKAKVKWSQQFSAELQVYIIHNMSSNLKVQQPIVSSEQALEEYNDPSRTTAEHGCCSPLLRQQQTISPLMPPHVAQTLGIQTTEKLRNSNETTLNSLNLQCLQAALPQSLLQQLHQMHFGRCFQILQIEVLDQLDWCCQEINRKLSGRIHSTEKDYSFNEC